MAAKKTRDAIADALKQVANVKRMTRIYKCQVCNAEGTGYISISTFATLPPMVFIWQQMPPRWWSFVGGQETIGTCRCDKCTPSVD